MKCIFTQYENNNLNNRKEITMKIPFNKPYMTGKELFYISQAHHIGHLSGDGPFTKKCQKWLEDKLYCNKALLTHSCTAALEIAAFLADIKPGDEVIMPSYTFVSTANAFVLRGATPVFIDINYSNLNIDEKLIENAITSKTKAIIPVHYAGVACEMEMIMNISKKYNLIVIEDSAQALLSTYKGRPLGSIGHLGVVSFHETKNIISGEGGALLINDDKFIERAEILREKGTNRSKFFRGEVDKYTWVDVGSSYLPSELIAAFLWAQMEEAEEIIKRRESIWKTYHNSFVQYEEEGLLTRPKINSSGKHNSHMYYILLKDLFQRNNFIKYLKDRNIQSVFHYVPLHSSPAGEIYGRVGSKMDVTNDVSNRLSRLPLWIGMEQHIYTIIQEIVNAAKNSAKERIV